MTVKRENGDTSTQERSHNLKLMLFGHLEARLIHSNFCHCSHQRSCYLHIPCRSLHTWATGRVGLDTSRAVLLQIGEQGPQLHGSY
jgi:hypothetical protein